MSDLIAININSNEHHVVREQFEKFRTDVVLKSRDDHLVSNYASDKFRVEDQLGTVVILNDCGNIVGFQSVYRPEHWPIGAVRVGNRSWIAPEFRSRKWSRSGTQNGTVFGARSVVAFIETVYQETRNICDQHDVAVAVITRQRLGSFDRSLSWLASRMKSGGLTWTSDTSGYYLTYDAPKNPSCWQRIAYTSFKTDGHAELFKIPRITDDVFDVRFGSIGVSPFP